MKPAKTRQQAALAGITAIITETYFVSGLFSGYVRQRCGEYA